MIGRLTVAEFGNAEQILVGEGDSDYERYIRTPELLVLQPEPYSWVHRDELLFTVTHQSSELWLKLAVSEIEYSLEKIRERNFAAAVRLLKRVNSCMTYCTQQLGILEQLTPWEYQKVRLALGHGSGFDSPGFRAIRRVIPRLGFEFDNALKSEEISLEELFINFENHEGLFQLAEALIDVDELLMAWRAVHFRVVERTIGLEVKGTQGTPVEVVGGIRDKQAFPDLWQVRSELTRRADKELRTD
jgi:tryptophan 2,3-dioxygenase